MKLFSTPFFIGWLISAARDLFDAITQGHLKIEIGQTFPISKAAEAHRALENRETVGSTVLIP